MQQSEQLINIFHVGFIICLCLAVVFAIVSIILFFRLRIRDVFDFLTGRAQKRSVKQMEEENAKTGKLRQDFYSDIKSSDLYHGTSGRTGEVQSSPITEQINSGTEQTEKTARAVSDPSNSGSNETTLLNSGNEETTLLNSGNDETTLLNSGNEETTLLNSGSEETTLLGGGNGETVLLTPDMEAALHKEAEEKPSIGTFIIIKEQMEIHTQEYI